MTTSTDDVTLVDNPEMTNCSDDYARRCKSIGMKRRNPRDLDSAMRHPKFNERHHQLLDDLATEYKASRPIMERAPWMTVTIGTHKSNKDLRKELEKSGHRIGDWGTDILKKTDVAAEPAEVDLIVLSNAELGFPNGCTVAQTYEAAQKLGLELCPAEVGPQLRLQYKDQPMNEWLLVAMDPITGSDGNLNVFRVVRREGGSWLHGNGGHPDNPWSGDLRWVFVRRK